LCALNQAVEPTVRARLPHQRLHCRRLWSPLSRTSSSLPPTLRTGGWSITGPASRVWNLCGCGSSITGTPATIYVSVHSRSYPRRWGMRLIR